MNSTLENDLSSLINNISIELTNLRKHLCEIVPDDIEKVTVINEHINATHRKMIFAFNELKYKNMYNRNEEPTFSSENLRKEECIIKLLSMAQNVTDYLTKLP